MVADFVLLWNIFVHSPWPCDHDSSKQKVKTIDIQNIGCSIYDDGFKDGIFFIVNIREG